MVKQRRLKKAIFILLTAIFLLGFFVFRGPVAAATCGNAIVESGEECDDGNIHSGDGCSSDCKLDGVDLSNTPVVFEGKDGRTFSLYSQQEVILNWSDADNFLDLTLHDIDTETVFLWIAQSCVKTNTRFTWKIKPGYEMIYTLKVDKGLNMTSEVVTSGESSTTVWGPEDLVLSKTNRDATGGIINTGKQDLCLNVAQTGRDNSYATAARLIREFSTLTVKNATVGSSEISNDKEVIKKYYETGTFSPGGLNISSNTPPTITIGGNTSISRPTITYKLDNLLMLRDLAIDRNVFYFTNEGDNTNKFALRIVHSKVNKNPSSANDCIDQAETKFVFMNDLNNFNDDEVFPGDYTILLNDTFFTNLINKYYNKVDGTTDITSDTKACPEAKFIKDDEMASSGLNTGRASVVDSTPDKKLYEKGRCTGEPFKDISQLIDPPQGFPCYLIDIILGGLEVIFKWTMVGGGSTPESPPATSMMPGATRLSAAGDEGLGGIAGQLLIGTGNFAENEVVVTVWGTIRDLINALFLVVFLFSILVTVLKIDSAANLASWQMKKMIPSIIATMILVNFSLSIANLVIAAMDALVKTFTIDSFPKYDALFSVKDATIMGALIRLLLALALTIICLYLALLLWIRRYIILFLYMAAAVPYVANVIPVGEIKKITGFWWENFFKWAFMGPVAGLFIYAAAKATTIATGVGVTSSIISGAETEATTTAGGKLEFTNLVLVIVLFYLAATVPLKLGGKVMGAASDLVMGKKGGALNPMARARTGAKEFAGGKVAQAQKAWFGAAAAGKKGEGGFGSKMAAGITGFAQRPHKKFEQRTKEAAKAKSDWEKVSTEEYVTPKDIEEGAEKAWQTTSAASAKDTALTHKSAKKRAEALKILQMKMLNQAGTEEGVNAELALKEIAQRNNLKDSKTGGEFNAKSDVDIKTGQKMKIFASGIGGANDAPELQIRLASMPPIDVSKISPLAVTKAQKDAMAELSRGALSDANVQASISDFKNLAEIKTLGGNVADDLGRLVESSDGDEDTIRKAIEDKLGAGSAESKAVFDSSAFKNMMETTKAKNNLNRLNLVVNQQNRTDSALFIRDAVNTARMSGAPDATAALEANINLVETKLGGGSDTEVKAAFEEAQKLFAPSYLGRTNASAEELRAHMANLKDAIENSRSAPGGPIDTAKLDEYIKKTMLQVKT